MATIKEYGIKKIESFIDLQGTLVQEDNFEQVPVHHMTTRELNVDGDVVLYIGANGLFCESGSKYLYTELDTGEVLDIVDFLNLS
jgi:hypothetical protein